MADTRAVRADRTANKLKLKRIQAVRCLLSLLLPSLVALPSTGGELNSLAGCQQVHFGERSQLNIACQCDTSRCDQLAEFQWPAEPRAYLRVLSSKAGARFQRDELRNSAANATAPDDYLIEVNVNEQRQQVLGFGAAFTDSALQVLSSLPEPLRQRAFDDYFGPHGLDYNMGRVPIAGTDMSTRAYTYDDVAPGDEDLALERFALQPEDLELKIPAIKRVNAMRAARSLGPLKLMAASWSAPAWMKSNQCLVQGRLKRASADSTGNGGGGGGGGLYYDAYARYVIRFLHEYEREHNISMWALSAQNEPYSPKRVGPLRINFNSVNFEPDEMADYLANSLVPALARAGKTPDKLKLFLWDDTLDGLARYQDAALASQQVRDFALGLAIHWYSTGLNQQPYRYLEDVRRRLPPRMLLVSTEASFIGRPRPGEWARGQRYALDMIENLRAGSCAWMDWNLALNVSGGPTWSHNILDAAMLVDTRRQVYLKNPMYYAMGHLSRFIKPNARIVHSQVLQAPSPETHAASGAQELSVVAAELEAGGARRSERRVALVALNQAAQSRAVSLRLAGCKLKDGEPPLRIELPANSITSLAFIC